ncbi:hypothetical protein MSG28_005269 [Choristoneura fumiferana]|uniref:Uncharacterized protein n=1 Tax=Choristoneura fumiferana TaxID=7141 RepID=A0ACC0JQI0_CHOFU|nr:hypothetical protein MSG28_005269 [Choristoneura fumiferana]
MEEETVAKELKNLVEEQRAMATLGRIYLLQGQSSTGSESTSSLKAAEKAFMKSLVLCESLNGKINKHELMDMRARLLLNIGVVQEHLGYLEKAVDCINKAVTICSNQDLYDILHQCYITEALLYSNKHKDYTKALSCLNKALEARKMCETLSSKADILCKMSDYQSAKQVLLKAWKVKTPDEEEAELIETNLKAKEWNKRKYEIRILKTLLKYQEEYYELDKMEETQNELRALGYDNFDNLDNSEDEQSSAGGNKLLVERLIAKGHPVNIRDNAGWLPLHEACIHGHLEIANILINSGANINDRGGSNCDGITPLHDAASNGHLEVVQLLLNKGAIPSLKNDLGETPLNILQKWRTKTILTKEEEVLYKNICNKIHSLIDKTNAGEVLNRSKSKTPVKPTRNETPPSTSKMTSKIRELHSPVFKKRNVIDDDSDDEMNLSQNPRNQIAFPSDDSNSNDSSDDCKTTNNKEVSGVNEYRNVISALRNRVANDSPEVDVKKSKPRSALLDANEVDDDWLEDDMGVNKNKKRKLSDPLTVVVAKKPSYDSVKDSIDSINKITEPLIDSNFNTHKSNDKQKKRTSDVIDVSTNSSDSDNFQRNENICPGFKDNRNASRELDDSKLKDSRESMRRRWKRQSTLLKAGFQRNREDCDQSSNSGSECEFTTRSVKRLTPTGTFSRKSSGENFSNFSPRKQNEGFNIMQNMNPSVMQPLNVIQPINIVQSSKNGRPMQTQILPPAAVKVQVEDKVLLISLKLDMINKLTISWLVDEVKTRYYK